MYSHYHVHFFHNINNVIIAHNPKLGSMVVQSNVLCRVNEELKAAAWCKQKVIFCTTPSCFIILLNIVLYHLRSTV